MTTKKKKVLLAEENDAARGIAELILRQNGFEVITLSTAAKALEVLQFTRPDLIIIGGDLFTGTGEPLYQWIQKNKQTASIPLLLFAVPDGQSLPFPDEVIISKPFDQDDFLERVRIFSGQAGAPLEPPSDNPLERANLNEEFLDAALGLDSIQVTESEIMDKTSMNLKVPKKNPLANEAFVGVGGVETEDPEPTDSGRVESLMITDPQTDIRRPKTEKRKKVDVSTTGKLEILNDQYGLVESESTDTTTSDRDHDYDWFINEMQKEVQPTIAPVSKSSEDLSIDEPASMVDPVTPVHSSPKPGQAEGEGVEKYIDEFKQEIEKFESDEPAETATPTQVPPQQTPPPGLTPQAMDLFINQLTTKLAEQIATRIAAKIDSDKLLNLIKAEILSHLKQQR